MVCKYDERCKYTRAQALEPQIATDRSGAEQCDKQASSYQATRHSPHFGNYSREVTQQIVICKMQDVSALINLLVFVFCFSLE
jgi:hypothetical protein